mgnify:CR=1 FL=1
MVPTLVFRRNTAGNAAARVAAIERLTHRDEAFGTRDEAKRTDPEKALRAQIDQLTKQLDDLKAAAADKSASRVLATFKLKDVGGDVETGTQLLTSLFKAKYGAKAAGGLKFGNKNLDLWVEGGTEEQFQWLVETVKGMNAPKGAPK